MIPPAGIKKGITMEMVKGAQVLVPDRAVCVLMWLRAGVQSTMLSIGGQLMSDFTQEMCHDEPTYEVSTSTVDPLVYNHANPSPATEISYSQY